MNLQTKRGPRANGGRRWNGTAGNRRDVHYSTSPPPSSTSQTQRAGAIIDDWVTRTFAMATRMETLLDREGYDLPERHRAALEYLTSGFTHDWPMQITLFMGWRADGVTWLVRDPGDLRAHNIAELAQNLEVFARILEASGRIPAMAEGRPA